MRSCSQMSIQILFQRDTAVKTCSRTTAVASILMCHAWLLLVHQPERYDAIVLETSSGVCLHFIFSCLALGTTYLGRYFETGWDRQLLEKIILFWIYSWTGTGEMWAFMISNANSNIISKRYTCLKMPARDCSGQRTHVPCVTSACTLTLTKCIHWCSDKLWLGAMYGDQCLVCVVTNVWWTLALMLVFKLEIWW